MSEPTFPCLLRKAGSIAAFGLALLSVPACIAAAEIVYDPVGANVSYNTVESLAYREPDVRIAYGSDALQFGLLWLPDNAASPVPRDGKPPVVVLVHGGCWLNAYDIAHTYALSTALAGEGYAVWSLEYRRTGDAGGGWPGSFNDVVAGVNHVRNLQHYEVDTGRFVIAGHSAGGHLALLAGRETPAATAVFGLAAITDISEYAAGENSCEAATSRFMGGTPQQLPEAYLAANPGVLPTHANTVLLHGGADALVSVNQGLMVGARTLFVDGGGHFDWVHPGTPSYRVMLATLQSVMTP